MWHHVTLLYCRQGILLVNELDDKQLFVDSGDILEQQKQYSEAAAMYIKKIKVFN